MSKSKSNGETSQESFSLTLMRCTLHTLAAQFLHLLVTNPHLEKKPAAHKFASTLESALQTIPELEP